MFEKPNQTRQPMPGSALRECGGKAAGAAALKRLDVNMTTTYTSSVFAWCYLGVLIVVASVWFVVPAVPSWAAVVLVALGVLGLPFTWAKVQVDGEGITQRSFRRHRTAKWADIISWRRVSQPDSDGQDIITITTRAGSFALNHNCVYGSRLDYVESELRRRIGPTSRCTQQPPPLPVTVVRGGSGA